MCLLALQELKRQQEEEDARLEEQRIAAEQAHLTAQFQDEQDSGRTRANRRSSRGGGAEGEQQGSMSAAGGRSTGGGSDLLTSKSEGRRRTSGRSGCRMVDWTGCWGHDGGSGLGGFESCKQLMLLFDVCCPDCSPQCAADTLYSIVHLCLMLSQNMF